MSALKNIDDLLNKETKRCDDKFLPLFGVSEEEKKTLQTRDKILFREVYNILEARGLVDAF